MKKFTSFICCVVAIVLLLAVMIGYKSFSDKINPTTTDNANIGTLSVESYNTEEEASKAFLNNEIKGEATNPVFESFTVEKKLDKTEIQSLNVPGLSIDQIAEGELVTIKYSDETDQEVVSIASNSDDSNLSVVKLYFFKTVDNEFRYFVPSHSSGEVISMSYYNRLSDPSKYVNFTCVEKTVMNGKAKIDGDELTDILAMETYSTIKVDGNVGYLTMKYDQMTIDEYVLIATKDNETKLVFVEVNNDSCSIIMSLNYSGESVGALLSPIGSLTDSTMVEALGGSGDIMKLDYSYFVKTDDGFAMNSKKANKWFGKIMKTTMDSVLGNSAINVYKAEYNFKVNNDRIEKATSAFDFDITINSYGMTIFEKLTGSYDVSFKDFGTTEKIVIPEVVTKYLTESGYTIV